MLNRRHLLAAFALATTVSFAPVASATDKKPFDQAAFDAAQAAGKPILVEVTAPWCPTCKAQAPTLSKLRDVSRVNRHTSRFDNCGGFPPSTEMLPLPVTREVYPGPAIREKQSRIVTAPLVSIRYE